MTNPLSLEPKGGYTPEVTAAADRELLELAAKAAGLPVEWDGRGFVIESMLRGHLANYDPWNPLHDDGDAMRLAVKLRMKVEGWYRAESACAYVECGRVTATEPHYGDDPCRATRRAIVYAAAAIARATGA